MVIGVGISLEPFNLESSAAFGDLVLCCIVGKFPLLVASSCTTIHALHFYRLFTFVISALSIGRLVTYHVMACWPWEFRIYFETLLVSLDAQ